MKKLLLFIILLATFKANAQTASGLLPFQATPYRTWANDNIMGTRLESGVWRIYNFDKYVLLDTTNATGKFATKYDVSQRVTNAGLSAALANYVTAASLSTTLNAYATTSALTSGLATKENTITASDIFKYWRGDKTWQTLNTSAVPESGALYFTDGRARLALTMSNTGTSGNATYNSTTGVINVPNYTTTVFGRSGNITAQSGDYNTSQVTESTNLYFTNARARGALSAGNNISYDNSTGVIALTQPTIATTSRTLNSNYTISTTKFAQVSYSISLSVTNPLLAGNSTASIFLEYSTNGGGAWTTVSQAVNQSSVGVAVAVAITNNQTSVVSGTIPANALVRLRSTTSGTASVTFVSSQEVVY